MDDADLPELPPVLTVGREAQVLALVEEDFGGLESRPAGKDLIVVAHDISGAIRRRDHEGWHLTQVQQHEGAMLLRQGVEGAVRERAELMEVAYEGKLGRGRGHAMGPCTEVVSFES